MYKVKETVRLSGYSVANLKISKSGQGHLNFHLVNLFSVIRPRWQLRWPSG